MPTKKTTAKLKHPKTKKGKTAQIRTVKTSTVKSKKVKTETVETKKPKITKITAEAVKSGDQDAELGFIEAQLCLDGNANDGEHHPDHEAHRERHGAHNDDRPCLVLLRCHEPPLGWDGKMKRLQGVFYANLSGVASGRVWAKFKSYTSLGVWVVFVSILFFNDIYVWNGLEKSRWQRRGSSSVHHAGNWVYYPSGVSRAASMHGESKWAGW